MITAQKNHFGNYDIVITSSSSEKFKKHLEYGDIYLKLRVKYLHSDKSLLVIAKWDTEVSDSFSALCSTLSENVGDTYMLISQHSVYKEGKKIGYTADYKYKITVVPTKIDVEDIIIEYVKVID